MKARMARITGVALALVLVVASAYAQGTTAGELTSANAQRAETSFGDLTADALATAAGTKIAFVPAVSFKSGTIPIGPVTKDAVAAVLTQPEETWAVVSLSGAKLREALERSVSRAPLPNAGFLQISGIVLTYDPAAARNARIGDLKVDLKVAGADGPVAVDPAATYEVAMPLSLAKGGSGYFTVFGEGDIVRSGDTQLADAIVSFVAAKESVGYPGAGRIKVVE